LNVRHRGISGGLHELVQEWLSTEAEITEFRPRANGVSPNGMLAGTTRTKEEGRT
jgi:hypothetical protein